MKSAINKWIDAAIEAWENYSHIIAILIIIFGTLLGVAVVFGIICLRAWIVMLLWNWIVVSLFNVPALSFWFSVGLCTLCSMLFKSSSNKSSEKD